MLSPTMPMSTQMAMSATFTCLDTNLICSEDMFGLLLITACSWCCSSDAFHRAQSCCFDCHLTSIATCFRVLWGCRKGRPGRDYKWSNDQPLDPMSLFPPGALDGVHLRRIASMLSDQHVEQQGSLVGCTFALASCVHLGGWQLRV